MIVIRELAEIFAIHEIDSEVLAASIRNPLHMTQAALAGAHIATLPFKVLQQMVHHPLTDKGIVQFKADWEKARKAMAVARLTPAAPRAPASGSMHDDVRRPRSGSRSHLWRTSPWQHGEEILGQFLGDDDVPGHLGRRGREGLLLGLRRPAHPAPGQPDVLRHRRLVASCDHMFRRFGTPFAVDWLAKNVNGYVYTTAIPADPDLRIEGTEYSVRYGARVPRDAAVRDDDGRLSRHRPAGLRPRLRRLVARPPAAGDGAQLRVPRGAARRRRRDEPGRRRLPPRGRDRHPRSPLEDPLDAQLRPALGDAQAARGDGEDARQRRRGAPRPAPELGLGPQLGLDRGALADEERGPRRRRAAGRVRVRGRRRDRRRRSRRATRPPVHRRAGRAVPARVRLARRLEPRVHLPDGPRADGARPRARPRLPRDGLRLPERDRGDAPRHRGGVLGDPRRAQRRGARGDAGGQRGQPADGAADARPPLLHRPGRQRPRAAGAHGGRPEAGRGRPARSGRRRHVPALQRAPGPHRERRALDARRSSPAAGGSARPPRRCTRATGSAR